VRVSPDPRGEDILSVPPGAILSFGRRLNSDTHFQAVPILLDGAEPPRADGKNRGVASHENNIDLSLIAFLLKNQISHK
jgi:hypothetical protein